MDFEKKSLKKNNKKFYKVHYFNQIYHFYCCNMILGRKIVLVILHANFKKVFKFKITITCDIKKSKTKIQFYNSK